MEKVGAELAIFFVEKARVLQSDVIFIVCTLVEKLIATSQPARGNLDSYCKNVY